MADPPAEPSAATKVLNTTELLEQILLGVDNKTLLLSQRVSKTFKDTIDRSVKLQRALFFQQDPEIQQAVERGEEVDHQREYNPLLCGRKVKLGDFEVFNNDSLAICFDWYKVFGQEAPAAATSPASWQRMYFKHGSTPYRQCLGVTGHWENGDVIDVLIKMLSRGARTVREYEEMAVERIESMLWRLRQ